MTLKEAIAARQHSRLTQTDVAKLMGFNQSTVSSIESQTGRASGKTIKKYIKTIEQAVTLPQNKPAPVQLPFGFMSSSGVVEPVTPAQDEISKMLKQMEAMRDQFYEAMNKARQAADAPAPIPAPSATPLAIQKAYDAGAEAMRERILETFEGFVRSLRAAGETIPPGNRATVSVEVKS